MLQHYLQEAMSALIDLAIPPKVASKVDLAARTWDILEVPPASFAELAPKAHKAAIRLAVTR